jgi:tetratricopeptide (TPR) repeat protein
VPARRVLLASLAVFLAAFAAHARALGAGFVYDDHRFVEQNRALERIDPVAFFRNPETASASTGVRPDVYRPLRTLDYAIDRSLFGLEPAGWHAKNLLWHALAAVLLLHLLLPLLGGRLIPAALGALLFAVHPLTSEAATWVSSRGDVMALAFGLAALVVMERPGAARTAVGVGLGILACFAKESMLVLPALLPLRDLALPAESAPPRRTTWIRTGLLAVLVAGYLVLRQGVIGDLEQVTVEVAGGRAAIARGMLSGAGWYAGVLAAPHGFPFDAMLPLPLRWTDPEVVLGAGLLGTIVVGGVLALRRGPRAVGFGLLGALVCLVPVSNVLVPLKTLVAERFLYPSLACLAVAIGWTLVRVPWLRLPAAVAALALAAMTFSRDASWANDETLWQAVRHDRPDNPRAYEGLARVWAVQGHADKAELAYRSYLEANPNDGKSWAFLGDLFADLGRSLVLVHPEPGEHTNVSLRRAEVLRAALVAYRSALGAWDRVGLVRGRGDEGMLREVLEKRFTTAVMLGDLGEAKEANDGLLRREGLGDADPETVRAKASWLVRFQRAGLALNAVRSEPPKNLPPDLYKRYYADRAAVLRDAGIDPLLPNEEALRIVEPLLGALSDEKPDALPAALEHVDAMVLVGEKDRARKTLQDLLRRFPNDREVTARLALLGS